MTLYNEIDYDKLLRVLVKDLSDSGSLFDNKVKLAPL